MRKKVFILAVFFIILGTSGCFVKSLNPFYTDEYKVDLPQIMGEWKLLSTFGNDVSEKEINFWRFSDDKIETYDEHNTVSEIEATYFKVNGNDFVDWMPGEVSESHVNLYWALLVFPAHTVFRVKMSDDTLLLIPLDPEWLKSLVQEKKLSLPFVESDEDDENTLYTVKPEEWIEFLKDYGNNEDAFGKGTAFILKRVTEVKNP